MSVPRLAPLSVTLLLAACGPQPAEPTAITSTSTASSTSATSGSAGAPTSSDGSTTAETTAMTPDSSTGEPTPASSSGPTTSASTSDDIDTDATTGEDAWLCNGFTCEENEHCTPEARVNADITGTTPLGAFAGTFAFASAALAFGELGTVHVLPEYTTDICAAAPMLRIEFEYGTSEGDFMAGATISIDDGAGQLVQTTTTVHVGNCCQTLWFCDCDNPLPYELELDVAGEGWSLTGTARPNCCRSYSIDEAA